MHSSAPDPVRSPPLLSALFAEPSFPLEHACWVLLTIRVCVKEWVRCVEKSLRTMWKQFLVEDLRAEGNVNRRLLQA